jgi:hypothetical protein
MSAGKFAAIDAGLYIPLHLAIGSVDVIEVAQYPQYALL